VSVLQLSQHSTIQQRRNTNQTMETTDDKTIPLITPAFVEDSDEHLGCCVDARQSIIALQLIFGVICGSAWIFAYLTGKYDELANGAKLREEMHEIFEKISILSGIGICVAFIVIAGAILYNVLMVILGIVHAIAQNTLALVILHPIIQDHLGWCVAAAVVFTLAFIYPHVLFAYQYKSGLLRCNRREDNLRAQDAGFFCGIS
jgi:hypothetical protein